MKKLTILLIILLYSLTNINAVDYAVLISAGRTTDASSMENGEYWNDLFIAYEELILNEGYDPNNVFVFYGNGPDDHCNSAGERFNLSLHGWDHIIDFDNSYNTLNTEFANIGAKVTNNDNLHIHWVMSHGIGDAATGKTSTFRSSTERNPINNDDYWVVLENRDLKIRETEIIRIINQIENYKRRTILWMTCYSGCINEGNNNLNNDKTVLLTSSKWNQTSIPKTYGAITIFSEFNWVVVSSLYGKTPGGSNYYADYNSDKAISMWELWYEASNGRMSSEPQLGDFGGVADRTYIASFKSQDRLIYTTQNKKINKSTFDWVSDPIDISSAPSVTISMDIEGASPATMEPNDYLNIYYTVGNSDIQLVSRETDGFNNKTVSVNGIRGSNVRLYIEGKNSANDETYNVTNLRIVREDDANANFLTVNNGGHDAYYETGEVIKVTANSAPKNHVFDKWLIVSGNPQIVDIYSKSTNMRMPANDVEITASYKEEWFFLSWDDFENGYGMVWNDGGEDCKVISTSNSPEGDKCLNLQNNSNSSSSETRDLPLANYLDIKVDFLFKSISMEEGEKFKLQISTDDGATYSTAKTWVCGQQFSNNQIYYESEIISGYSLSNETRVRFKCEASDNADDVYIDLVKMYVRQQKYVENVLYISEGKGSGEYIEGNKVNIIANKPRPNMMFDHWEEFFNLDVEIEDIYSPNTIITMPNRRVDLRPKYRTVELVELSQDDFDYGFGAWTSTGYDCIRATDNPISGSHSLMIRNDNSSSKSETVALPCLGYDDILLEFEWKAVGTETGDEFWLDISVDNGNTWDVVQSWRKGTDYSNNDMVFYEYKVIEGYALTHQTKLRFRSTANSFNDMYYFENVNISMIKDPYKSAVVSPLAELSLETDNFKSHGSYPNPFGAETTIKYELTEDANISLSIYNMLGQEICTLVNEHQSAGIYSKVWNPANNIQSGIYLYVIRMTNENGSVIKTQKMNFIK